MLVRKQGGKGGEWGGGCELRNQGKCELAVRGGEDRWGGM